MLLTAIKLKLAAMVAVAGLNTDDMTSPQTKSALETLAQEQTAGQTDKTKDLNAALSTALTKIKELADKKDVDANYALAKWATLGVVQGATGEQVLSYYQIAADGGHAPAMFELGGLLLQAYPQDAAKVSQAIDLIKKAESKGNNDARLTLAQLSLNGAPAVGIERSVDKAKGYLEKASGEGHGASTMALSKLYAVGVPPEVPQDKAKALDYLKTAAEKQSFAPAMSELAAAMFAGNDAFGVKKDPAGAIKMFTNAAEKGNAAANRALGTIYQSGADGAVTKDLKKAVEYYTAGANGGDPEAQFIVGNFLENGLADKDKDGKDVVLVQPNPKAALDLYRLAAQSGMAFANYNVGAYYESGKVVDRDLAKAFGFYQRAATSGLAQAQHKVASFYQNGAGVGQDIVAAFAWYERAADQGFALSRLVLGAMYELGTGKAQNYGAAMAQYQAAAEQGMPLAMLRLASLHERGLGYTGTVKVDLVKAWAYAKQAVDASKEDPAAVNYLKELEKKMSDADKAEAKKVYEQNKAKTAASASGTAPAAPASTPAPTTTPKGKGIR